MDFYYMDLSAACRSVLLTAKILGVPLNKKILDVPKGEQNTPEFLKINFQHCIPTLVDGDLKLWESRVICTYLVSQYGKDDTLYPKNPKQRALVDRLLFFDLNTLYHRFGEYVYPVQRGEKPNPEKATKLQEGLGILDKFLEQNEFAAGNHITVADICLVATVSTIHYAGIDISKHPNVVKWFDKCKKRIPGYDTENVPGAKKYGGMIKEKFGN